MATITADVGGGAWATGATWVGGVAPTSADNVLLISTSGNITSVGPCRSIDCTSYTGVLTHPAATEWVIGDGTAGLSNIAIRLVSGMTYTLGDPVTSTVKLVSTSATQQSIYPGSRTFGGLKISGVGSSYILQNALTMGSASTLHVESGIFNTSGSAITCGFFNSSYATARTLTMSDSAITLTGTGTAWTTSDATNLTITANTAVITLSGAGSTFNGSSDFNGASLVFTGSGNQTLTTTAGTFANVTRTGTAIKGDAFSLGGSFTCTAAFRANGNSLINRMLVLSSVVGTARTITAASLGVSANVDFQDITAAGASTPWTGTSFGDCQGNASITTTTPATQTHTASAGGNWSDATKWTSRVPLPQDNVVVDVNTTGTLTADMPRLGADITFAGFAGTAAFSSVANAMYGGLVLGSGMTISGAQALNLSARSSKTITSNGKTLTQAVTQSGPGGTYTLADALNTDGVLLVQAGTFTTASFTVTCSNFSMNTVLAAVANLGASVVNLTNATASNLIVISSSTATLNGGTATFNIVNASTFTRGISFGTTALSSVSGTTINYTVAGSTGALNLGLGNASTYGTLNFSDANNARTLTLFAGVTNTFTGTFNVQGTAGKLMTIESSTPGVAATISKSSGTVVCDYLSVKDSTATGGAAFYAGVNSTNVSGNSGWVFTGAPSAQGSFLALV